MDRAHTDHAHTHSAGPVPHGHDHAECVRDALDAAARICAARGAQLTPLRRRVLELIWSSHRAVKAYDLLAQLGDGERRAKPPTVYRALDFLIAHGLAHRVDSLNAFVGCATPEANHQGHFLICAHCGDVAEIRGPRLGAAIRSAAADADFQLQGHTVELRGLCSACRHGEAESGEAGGADAASEPREESL